MEPERSGPCIICFLLGLLPDPDPCRLGLDEVFLQPMCIALAAMDAA